MEPVSEPISPALRKLDCLPEIVVYEHINWQGWNYRTNMNVRNIGTIMNDQVSSFVIVKGTWQFYKDENFLTPMGGPLGPGCYDNVTRYGIENDQITAFKCLEW